MTLNEREKELELFNSWADFEGLDIKMSSETEHSSKETHLAFLAWLGAKAQAVPEGYVVVPKEPTEKMLKRGNRLALSDSQYRYDAASIYEVMLETSESGAEG